MHFAICDFLLDVGHNAVEAGCTRLELDLIESANWFSARCVDNGKGMNPEQLAKALDPFYSDGVKHPNRRVGLGLPFLQQACESLGGQLEIKSEPGTGTSVHFRLPLDNVDSPPVGDLVQTLLSILTLDAEFECVVSRRRGANEYTLTRSELVETLGELQTVGSIGLLREFLRSLEEDNGENDA